MIKELFYKWFGIEPMPCPTCEVLRIELAKAQEEKKQLLDKLINKPEEKEPEKPTDFQQIHPMRTTWRIRQQMLEAEDRAAAKKLREKQEEMQSVEQLEKEVGVANGE